MFDGQTKVYPSVVLVIAAVSVILHFCVDAGSNNVHTSSLLPLVSFDVGDSVYKVAGWSSSADVGHSDRKLITVAPARLEVRQEPAA